MESKDEYDYIVIGGGSGGLASARRAAHYGAKVALIEQGSIGGTCVNRGCVPKKLMFHAGELANSLRLFTHYGFGAVGLTPLTPSIMASEVESLLEAPIIVAEQQRLAQSLPDIERSESSKKIKRRKDRAFHIQDGTKILSHAITPLQKHLLVDPGLEIQLKFDWGSMKQARDDYIRRLHGIYLASMEREHVKYFVESAEIISPNTVKLTNSNQTLKAKHVLLASGSTPTLPKSINGYEYTITSDEFFNMTSQPKRVGIIGGGYIGVELAGILHSLGSQVHLWCRADRLLRRGHFDSLMSEMLFDEMIQTGILVRTNTNVISIEKASNDDTNLNPFIPLNVTLNISKNGKEKKAQVVVDIVIVATGRRPNLSFGLKASNEPSDKMTLKLNNDGMIIVNDLQETNIPNVYAVGDITTQRHLTPVAIAAGRALADRLFGGPDMSKKTTDLRFVPSVVFSHPPIGVVGSSEEEAREKYGSGLVKAYVTRFTNLVYGMIPPGHRDRRETIYKIVTVKQDNEELVVGIHLFGHGSDEILQGFAVAMGMGMTKADLDRTIAIHPTSAEELINMK